jgi:hypothetical protein
MPLPEKSLIPASLPFTVTPIQSDIGIPAVWSVLNHRSGQTVVGQTVACVHSFGCHSMTATCRLSFNKYQYSLGAGRYTYVRVPKSGIPMFLEKKIAKKVIDAERSVFGL